MKFLALALILAAQASQPVADDYLVSGTVVDHLTNRPINFALVQLIQSRKGGDEVSVLTGADGRFSFLHVPKGKYILQAQRRGQNPQAFHATAGYSTQIVVDGIQKYDNLTFPLRTDAFIDGTITDESGEPAPNIQLSLFREDLNTGEPMVLPAGGALTRSSGHFHFGHLQPGNYYIAAIGAPWYSQNGRFPGLNASEMVYPVTFYGDTTNPTTARVITLTEGSSANVQMTLRAVPAIHVKVPGGRQNFVLYAPGPGGTQVNLRTSFINPNAANGIRSVRPAGRFGAGGPPNPDGPSPDLELTGIPAGRYEVTLFNQRVGNTNAAQTVDLANGSTLTLEPPTPATITGRVIFDTPAPHADAKIKVFLGAQRMRLEADVNADGSFKIEKASPGKFNVNITNDLAVLSVAAKGAHIENDRIEIAPAANIELTIHVAATESLATLDGIATQSDTPTPGAMVLLLPTDPAQPRLIRRDQSDSDGSFHLTEIRPGQYTLIAIDDGENLAYKNETAIKPYLANGVPITIPLTTKAPIKLTVQPRQR